MAAMRIAYVLYPGFTALDIIGPYEVTSRWPDAEVHFLATSLEPVRADMGLTVTPTDTPATLPDPDVIIVPGATDPVAVMSDEPLLDWVRSAAPQAQWIASVCTGAGIYAAAGLLDGRRTTTHWAFRENLRAMGIDVVADRVVFDEPFVSGAGVSAGIDMALALTARVHGEKLAKTLQLAIEYDPQPPFDSGSPEKAESSTLRLALRMLLGDSPSAAARVVGHLVGQQARRVGRAIRAR
jgi:transcriptional regulator GlxA family with amidase domain